MIKNKINFDAFERIYNDYEAFVAQQKEREAESAKCATGKCDHPRYKDGKPAVKADGTPDRRVTCSMAHTTYRDVTDHQHDYTMDLGTFFKEVIS